MAMAHIVANHQKPKVVVKPLLLLRITFVNIWLHSREPKVRKATVVVVTNYFCEHALLSRYSLRNALLVRGLTGGGLGLSGYKIYTDHNDCSKYIIP